MLNHGYMNTTLSVVMKGRGAFTNYLEGSHHHCAATQKMRQLGCNNYIDVITRELCTQNICHYFTKTFHPVYERMWAKQICKRYKSSVLLMGHD